MKPKVYQDFLALVRGGIGKSQTVTLSDVDWRKIQAIADQQGLYAVVLDGIEKLPSNIRPPQEMLLEWIGEVLQGFELFYEQCAKTISEMAHFYNSHGYKMMVLKGYACSLDWPNPNHRPCGDIDIWQFGDYKKADALLQPEKGIKVENSHHHHTVFCWGDFIIENHYDFINIHHHKSHAKLEKILKKLASDDTHNTELYGEKVYLPSPDLHALFLLKHTMLHFVSGEINLRQLIDWAFFVEKHHDEVDWKWLESVLDEFGMMPLYQLFNAICVEDLGFEQSLFPPIQYNPILKANVFKEILMPEFDAKMPKNLIKRVVHKWRRWKGSEWKHQLCYNESMWSAFWYGMWSHLLKPVSI